MSRTSTDTVESLTTVTHVLPRVNLLPPEVHEARKLRRLQLGLGAGVALVAVALGGLYVVESSSAHHASEDLATVKAQAVTLNAQKAQFADVPKTLSAIESAQDARQSAMANDVAWYRYLNDLSFITPSNTWLTQMTITVTGATPAAGSSSSTSGSAGSALAAPGVGTVSFVGTAKNHNDVAAWLDAIAKEKGWTNVYFTNSAAAIVGTTPVVNFTSSVTVSADALSHRYDRKDG